MRATHRMALLLLLASCGSVGGDIGRAIDAYQIGDFAGMSELCQELGGEYREMNPRGRVRYLVYCGLGYYHTGDRRKASTLLKLGHDAYMRGEPRWLNAHVSADMDQALADLNKNPESAPASPPSP